MICRIAPKLHLSMSDSKQSYCAISNRIRTRATDRRKKTNYKRSNMNSNDSHVINVRQIDQPKYLKITKFILIHRTISKYNIILFLVLYLFILPDTCNSFIFIFFSGCGVVVVVGFVF